MLFGSGRLRRRCHHRATTHPSLMESSTFSHKESAALDFPNAFKALGAAVGQVPPGLPASGAPPSQERPPAPRHSAPRWAVLVAFAAVYLVWGSTYLGIRLAIASAPPLLMAGSRFLLAGSLLYALMRWRGAPSPPLRGWGTALVAGVLLLAFGNGGVTLGEQYLVSGLAALLAATVPLWMVLLGWLSGQTGRPSRWALAGLLAGLAGVYLVAQTAGPSRVTRPEQLGLGVGLALTAAMVWAIGSLYAKQKQAASSPFLASAMHMLCGGGALLLAGLLRGEATGFQLAAVTASSWLAFAYLVTFGSLIAFAAYNWLLQAVEPHLVGTYAFVNPVVAVLLGRAVGGEQLSGSMLGGAVLIVLAVILVVLGRPINRPPGTKA